MPIIQFSVASNLSNFFFDDQSMGEASEIGMVNMSKRVVILINLRAEPYSPCYCDLVKVSGLWRHAVLFDLSPFQDLLVIVC
jgi:hypothetical protein